jgi:hypothetical protein
MWAQEPPKVKEEWGILYQRLKLEHEEKYPGYKYKPNQKKMINWGTPECVCGAYQANQAKQAQLERSEADSESDMRPPVRRGRRQIQPTTSPGFEVNHGLPATSRKRKRAPDNLQPVFKRTARSPSSAQPLSTPRYQDGFAQPGSANPYGRRDDMAFDPLTGNLASTDLVPYGQDAGGSGGYRMKTSQAFGTPSRRYIANNGAHHHVQSQYSPSKEMGLGVDTMTGEYSDFDFDDPFWAMQSVVDTGGNWGIQQGEYGTNTVVADRTPTQASPTRRSNRLSAQGRSSSGGGGGGLAGSPTSTTRRSQRTP